MYLHEYQSKNILKKHNILTPQSYLLTNINQISNVSNKILGEKLVLKAQIHAGSRGKAGGIKIILNKKETIEKEINSMLNTYITTNQTDKKGKKVSKILIEEFIKIEKELYLSIYIDRNIENYCILISNFGGIEIEKTPENEFLKLNCKTNIIYDYQIRNIIQFLNLDFSYFEEIKNLITNLYKLVLKYDLLLLEINPLAIFEKKFYCVDAKFEIDDNSYFRNEELFKLYDYTQEDEIEIAAKKAKLSYISLDGNIGCMVNGAGLAMATMDLLNLYGGNPANFLDIGGNATEDTIKHAIKIICMKKELKGLFINIFGGIIRCDLIAESLINTLKNETINIPIVIRLAGNNSKNGVNKIKNTKLNIIAESNLEKAVKKIIKLSKV